MADTTKTIEKLEEVICKEIDETIADGKVNEPKLAVLYKAVDILKDIGEIKGHEDGYSEMGYSMRRMPGYMYDNSYARRGRDGDGDGRYSERPYYMMPYGNTYGNAYEGRGSYDNGMRQQLENLMNKTTNEQEREEIRKMLRQMDR